jgi:hypothetical protein
MNTNLSRTNSNAPKSMKILSNIRSLVYIVIRMWIYGTKAVISIFDGYKTLSLSM